MFAFGGKLTLTVCAPDARGVHLRDCAVLGRVSAGLTGYIPSDKKQLLTKLSAKLEVNRALLPNVARPNSRDSYGRIAGRRLMQGASVNEEIRLALSLGVFNAPGFRTSGSNVKVARFSDQEKGPVSPIYVSVSLRTSPHRAAAHHIR